MYYFNRIIKDVLEMMNIEIKEAYLENDIEFECTTNYVSIFEAEDKFIGYFLFLIN
jgi:hypothetical protein